MPNATYRNHGTHAEAIEIVFDPRTITYRRVLEFFFELELAQERRFALDEQLHGREA